MGAKPSGHRFLTGLDYFGGCSGGCLVPGPLPRGLQLRGQPWGLQPLFVGGCACPPRWQALQAGAVQAAGGKGSGAGVGQSVQQPSPPRPWLLPCPAGAGDHSTLSAKLFAFISFSSLTRFSSLLNRTQGTRVCSLH